MYEEKNESGGQLLNIHRKEIFGFAALMIVFGHSQDFVHSVFPDSLVSVIGYGGIGVTMFAFLSGIGLWHSLDNNDDILNFYKKRIKRVIIPYFFIAIPFCLFLDIYVKKDAMLFIQEVTCVGYWINGRGAWYVAWLIPVYAAYPLYGRIAHNRNWLSAVLAIVEIIMIALIGIPIRFQSVAAATLAFLIGDFLAKFIKANSVWAIRGAASLILFAPVYFFGILRTQTMYVISFACIGISLCAILAVVLDHGIKSMKRMLAEVGGVSLESYLFNIYIISVAKMILGNRIDGFEEVCGYVCVAIIGMFLSVLVGKLEKRM